jgi:hypothetical protein
MTLADLAIMLVCAAVGYGIVRNVIGASKRRGE